MTTTPSIIPPDLIKQVSEQSTQVAVSLVSGLAAEFWKMLQPHLAIAIIAFVLLLIWATVRAFMGKWGLLGKILYRVFLGIILGFAIVIKGFEILFSPYFDILYILACIASFNLNGLILEKFRRRY